MEIIYKSLEDIRPYENNPRRNRPSVEYVANSIRNFGFKTPILIDRNGVIIAGHTRYMAAREIGMKEVPCVMAEGLTEDEAKAFRLIDNKTQEYALWDFELLDDEMDRLADFDMGQYGFILNSDVEGGLEIGDFMTDRTKAADFTFTVNFPMEAKAEVDRFIENNGKEVLAEEVIRIIKEVDYA